MFSVPPCSMSRRGKHTNRAPHSASFLLSVGAQFRGLEQVPQPLQPRPYEVQIILGTRKGDSPMQIAGQV